MNVPPIPSIATVPELPDQSDPSAAVGPLQLAFDNWEEIDLSSRSADSLDELDDGASGASSMDDPVKLLSYKRFDGTLSEDEDMISVSDASDHSEEFQARRQRGFYDVRMLAGQNMFNDNSGGSSVPMDTSDLIHPDMKMEVLLSQLKRQKQLWKLQNQQEIAAASVAEAKRYLSGKPLTSTPVPKVRADDSWIKDSPVSPLPDLIMTTGKTAPDMENKHCENGSFLQVKPHDKLVRASSQNTLLDLMDAGVEPDQVIAMDVPLSPSKKEAVHHYHKEEIPWNPGTVKKQTKDIEEKIIRSSTEGKGERLSQEIPGMCVSGSSGSAPGSPQGSCEMLADESTACVQHECEMRNQSVPDEQSKVAVQQGSVINTEQSGNTEVAESGTAMDQCPDGVERREVTSGEVDAQDSSPDKRPTSIYDTEDIDWQPGMVQRTKEELMAKARY